MTSQVPIQYIDPKELKEKIDANSVTIVDVREDNEFEQEHILQSTSHPMSTFSESAIPQGKQVVFVCQKGIRAANAAQKWQVFSKQQPFVLNGGIDAWKKAGYSVSQNEPSSLEANSKAKMWCGGVILVSCMFALLISIDFLLIPLLMGALLIWDGFNRRCTITKILKRFFNKKG
ncbi:MAG: rhodanese-like domain-containing protein [Parachlamydiales bacterium]|nr:rhodanese-like domain-containing protein [Parachlamydiales bacterium]